MMSTFELRVTLAVAFIFFCRMMGLFMVLPVLSLYGMELESASLFLLGIAIGIYGLMQAFLQIPFSMLSDRVGRKKVMLFGLLLFLLGSLGAALANDVWTLIACRCLQGAGAIAGASLALLGDVSTERNRTRVMAVVGITIGASFVFALVAGPLVSAWVGLSGLFYFSALLAVVAIVICAVAIPNETGIQRLANVSNTADRKSDESSETGKLRQVLSNKRLLILAFAVLVLHLVMTASFVALPVTLETTHELARETHWKIYLGVFLVALILMGPFMRNKSSNRVSQGMTGLLSIAMLMMALVLSGLALFFEYYFILLGLLCFYFTSFNLLEALLPSQMSLEVNDTLRATAMGLFSTLQFLGAFIGGMLGGYLLEYFTYRDLLIVMAGLSILVLLVYHFVFVREAKKAILMH